MNHTNPFPCVIEKSQETARQKAQTLANVASSCTSVYLWHGKDKWNVFLFFSGKRPQTDEYIEVRREVKCV